MKSRAGLGVLLLAAALSDGRLIACGDKYLSVGFGTHFERTPAERKAATVLVPVEPGSNLERTFMDPAMKADITKEGYKPFVVSSPAALEDALQGRPPQVIICEGNCQYLYQRMKGKSRIVPVLYQSDQRRPETSETHLRDRHRYAEEGLHRRRHHRRRHRPL